MLIPAPIPPVSIPISRASEVAIMRAEHFDVTTETVGCKTHTMSDGPAEWKSAMMAATPTEDQLAVRSRIIRLFASGCGVVLLSFAWVLPRGWWPIEAIFFAGFVAVSVWYVVTLRRNSRAAQGPPRPEEQAKAKSRVVGRLRRLPGMFFVYAAGVAACAITANHGQNVIFGIASLSFVSGVILWLWVRKNSR